VSHQKLIVFAAWACIAAFAYATLTQVEFAYSIYYRLAPLLMWPKARTYGLFEHVTAFAVFGALFSLAYPRHIVFVCVVVFVTAVGLEYLQTMTPDRHGTLFDAAEKVAGGASGIAAAQAFLYLRSWKRKHAAQGQS
jgi:VanZ like family